MCGNSDILEKNVTMGQSWTSENTEGEDSNGGESDCSSKLVETVRKGGGGNHQGLLRIKFIRLCWKLKLKKLNVHKTN